MRAAIISLLSTQAACLAQPIELPSSEEIGEVLFLRDVRPIFAAQCFDCHGAARAEANLRLDQSEDVLGDRRGAPIVVPGSPDDSTLIQRLTSRVAPMPPIESQRAVSKRELAIIRKWIENGAPWIDHWAFTTPERSPIPAVSDPEWALNPIDAFVRARLDAEGIEPSPPADPWVLARRLALDLTGMPPSLEEAARFVADPSDPSFVDRLLASDRAAEHRARDWLDAARYADTHGYQLDLPRTMWAWRDWVIDAFKNNLPYDRFLTEQLTGDLLPDASARERIATGFNRNHNITIEGGVIDEEYRAIYVADRVDTLGQAVLGISIGCARCHDHKYDPIRQRDYYRLAACFNQTDERGLGAENGFAPTVTMLSPIAERELESIDREIAAREPELEGSWDAELAAFERAASLPIAWSSLRPSTIAADNDTTFTIETDDTIVAHDQEVRDAYHLHFDVAEGTQAFEIQALSGHGPEGSFVLTEVEGIAGDAAIEWAAAESDAPSSGFGAPLAIDRDPNTGWSADASEAPRLVLSTRAPLAAGPVHLRLHFGAGETRLLRSFRLRSSAHPLAGLPSIETILGKPASERSEAERDRLTELWLRHFSPKADAARELALLRARRDSIARAPVTLVMQDRAQPVKTFVLLRGRYDLRGDEVTCGVIETIHPGPRDAPANRLLVAAWLTDPAHPLTARVAVNRIWQRFFGAGLVSTSEELGTRGERPSHPELLDWLAVELIESGWDLRRIISLIATSRTYRQSSSIRTDAAERDPDNRLLWRGPRHRLDAEVIRDQALFASGLLVEKLGGPSAFPYQPPGLWEEVNDRQSLSVPYLEDAGDGRWRRSLYTFWKRTLPPPFLTAFDAPAREYSVVRRQHSSTPLQAIALLGETGMVEAARHLAERMLEQGGLGASIEHGFRRVLVRPPNALELAELTAAYEEQRALFADDPAAADRLLAIGASRTKSDRPAIDRAAMTQVARIILNLGEASWKE